MSALSLAPGDEKLKEIKNNFIIEQIQDYKTEDYTASDFSGCFRDSFKNWTVEDFDLCNYDKLIQLRKVLRDRGVYVDHGGTKSEAIRGLMEAVKKELPWPEQSPKPVLDPSGKRKAESFAMIFPQKTQGLLSNRKTEEDLFDSSSFEQALKIQSQPQS